MKLIPILALGAVSALAQQPSGPILRNTFASDTEGWVTMGKPGATLKVDGGSMVFGYNAAQQSMSVLVHPFPEGAPAGLQSVRFDVKTDAPFAIGVVLSEKKPGGGNYTAMFWSKGQQWQHIELALADFLEGEGPNEPVDANGKLDTDQIEGLGFLDVSQVFSQGAKPGGPIFGVPHVGEHTIFIRNFELSREPLPALPAMTIDDFTKPQAAWLSFAPVPLEQKDGALRITYQQQAEQVVAFLHPMPPKDYRGATHLAFDVESSRAGQFVLSLGEARHHGPEGPRYNVDFTILTPNQMEYREIALTAFTADDHGTPDPNGKLDLDQLRSLTLLDASQQDGNNTLTLKNLRFVKK